MAQSASASRDPLSVEVASLMAAAARLQRANEELSRRLAALEARVGSAAVCDSAESHPAEPPEPTTAPRSVNRRNILATAGLGAIAAGAGFLVARPSVARADSTVPLYTQMDFGGAVTLPALDTSVRWTRTDPVGVPASHTNEILSLISQNSQINSFAWPLYVQLGVTTATAATRDTSQSVGATVRMFNSSAGSPWAAAFHSEPQHGVLWDGTIHSTNATSIGYNMELTRKSAGGTAIGVEIMNTAASTSAGDYAVHVDGSWTHGVSITAAPNGAEPVGKTAINIAAPYEIGIDLGPNHLRMQAGKKIILDETDNVSLSYNRTTKNVELHKNDQMIAAW